MMNREQFLLMKLAEEASEVAQIALKTAQFGMEETHPKKVSTNSERIHHELNDLSAIVGMLNKEFNFRFNPSKAAHEKKEKRVNKYYGYSRRLGRVK